MKTSRLNLFVFALVTGVSLSACSDSKESTGKTGATGSSDPMPGVSNKTPGEGAKSSEPVATTKPGSVATTKPAPESTKPTPGPSAIVMEGTIEFGDSGASVTWTGEGVECAAARCRDAQLSVPSLPAPVEVTGCCTADQRCGVDMTLLGRLLGLTNPACEVFAPAANADPACPKSEPIKAAALAFSSGGAVQLDGCCQANGQCGFSADFSFIGFGCVDPSRFGQKGGTTCTPE